LVMAFMLPLYLILERRGDKYLTYLSVMSGTLIAFFDFLTTETLTILMPLALILAVRAKENRLGTFRSNLPLIIKNGAVWGVAYVATLSTKWMLTAVFTGRNTFLTAFEYMTWHSGESLDSFMIERADSFLSASIANVSIMFGSQARTEYNYALFGVLISAVLLLLLWYPLKGKENRKDAPMILLCLGSVVFIRYLVLNGHSFVHGFFTYRALATVVFGVLAAFWLNTYVVQKKNVNNKKRRRT